jgi:predicted nucleotidyltransferase
MRDTMSPLVRLADELGTTDRTLRRAIKRGLVRARRPSPRTVEIGPDEYVYLRQNWMTLSQLIEALRTEPSVRTAILFGSIARGDGHAQSDVDILVDLRDAAPGARLDLRRRLESAAGRPVQLVPWRAGEQAPSLLSEVIRDGRPLVDRDRVWPALLARKPAVDRAARAEARERALRLADLANGKVAA